MPRRGSAARLPHNPALEERDVLGFLLQELLGLLGDFGDAGRVGDDVVIFVASLFTLKPGLQGIEPRQCRLTGPNIRVLRREMMRPCEMRRQVDVRVDGTGVRLDLAQMRA